MIFRKIFQSDLPMCGVNFKVKVQNPEKAQPGTLKNMYVQYDCNRPSTFRNLRQNVEIVHSSEPKVGQSSYTSKATTRPPRGVVHKI